jgi:hypothetical protein
MDWLRWHHGTVNDPKWRLVARKSGQPVTAVIAVFATFLERASNSIPRGQIDGWDAEVIGVGLDLDADSVVAIHSAMQGKVLDGNFITSWEKRQPKREREDDTAADRKRAQRDREKEQKTAVSDVKNDGATTGDNVMSRHVTPCHTQIEEIDKKERKKESSLRSDEKSVDQKIFDAWNGMAKSVGLATVQKTTAVRHKLILARLKENTIEQIAEAFSKVPNSSFLLGKKSSNGHEGWTADFDYILRESTFAKLVEGGFNDHPPPPTGGLFGGAMV